MSKKLGRNKPCHCGSGKKYKKCCLSRDKEMNTQLQQPPEDPFIPTPPDLDTLMYSPSRDEPRATPYRAAKWADRADMQRRIGEGPRKALMTRWLPSKVAAMSTAEIQERLAKLGIDAAEERYKELARGKDSAWFIGADVWLASVRERLDSGRDEDFICLAACELWKRFIPDTASEEMRVDWLEDGYELMKVDDYTGSSDAWLMLWNWVHPRLTEDMRTLDAADPLLDNAAFTLNWVQDLCMVLRNVAMDQREYADAGVRFCEQLLSHFTEEDARVLDDLRCDLADMLFMRGDRARGEQILTQIVDRRPDEAMGYVRLSDALMDHGGDEADLDRALSLLEQAAARPVRDPEDWDLEVRLAQLRESRSDRSPGA